MIDKNISRILKERRSVFPKQFNGEIIEKKIVQEILINANQAPTHKMTQPWFFKVFSKSSKNKLKNVIVDKVENKSNLEKLDLNFAKTSHIICICMRRNTKVPEWEEIAATSMAVQNIWISCVNSNIGGYFSTPNWISEIKDFLNLKNNERCLGLFYLGKHNKLNDRNLDRKDIVNDTIWFE